MNRFLEFLKQAVAKLGLESKFAAKELTAEEQKSLIAAYEEASGTKFAEDLAAYQAAQKEAAETQAMAEAFKELASIFGKEVTPQTNAEEVISNIKASIDEMKATIGRLGSMSQGDEPQKTLNGPRISISGAHTKEFAFGVQHPMFASDKRWNRIAITGRRDNEASDEESAEFKREFNKYASSLADRYSALVRSNGLESVRKGTADYSLLDDAEIGTQYFVRRQDALIARIDSFPSLSGIFPTRSNIQDGDVLTNVLFQELSQAYQKGHLSKGGYTLQPEKARVHKVMMKYLIEDMTWIEESYLGYLNTSGSDPVKWSMIEWLVLCIAEQLNAEQIERQVLGYRVEPKAGENASGMFASTGVVHRLLSYFDNDRKVLPFFDEELAEYGKADIGDVLEAFMDRLSERVRNSSQYTVYVNAKHKPWFKAWYTATYGTNADFSGVQFKVPNYDNPIVFVPGMKNLKLIFATIPGNIQLLEFVPGERNKMRFQQDLEEVWVSSYWKEGAGVTYSGKKFNSLDELKAADATEQIIFMNWPMTEVDPDATTIDGKTDMFFKTGVNTKATALTDITNAQEDVIYRIEIGDDAYPTTIAKSGKFDQLTAAWSPTKAGEYIKLYCKGGKFYDVERG